MIILGSMMKNRSFLAPYSIHCIRARQASCSFCFFLFCAPILHWLCSPVWALFCNILDSIFSYFAHCVLSPSLCLSPKCNLPGCFYLCWLFFFPHLRLHLTHFSRVPPPPTSAHKLDNLYFKRGYNYESEREMHFYGELLEFSAAR